MLDHVRDADQAQQDEDGDDPTAGKGQEDEGERRQEVANIRDEAGEEDEDRERARERHAEDQQEDEVGQGIHGGVDRRPAQVAADLEERVVPGLFERRAAPLARRPEDPRPGLVTVHEQEEEREQRQHADRPERRQGTRDGRCLGRQPRLEPGRDVADEAGDLGRQRGVVHDRLKADDRLLDRLQDLDHIRDDRERDEDQRTDDDPDCTDRPRGGRLGPRPAACPHVLDVWRDRGRDEDGHDDGHRRRREGDGDRNEEGAKRKTDQDAPADRTQPAQPIRS